MYYNNIKNQVQFQKKLNFTSLSQKDLHTDHVDSLTYTEYHIYQELWKYRHYPSVKFKNETIAKRVGCTVRTVQRTTTKLLKAGLITKTQPNIHSCNEYKIIQNKQYSSQCEYVTPYKSYLILDSLFRRSCNVLVKTHTRSNKNKGIFNKKRGRKRREIMNAVQKHIILSNKQDPKLKEALRSESMWQEIITPTIQEISTLFELNEQEQFKLVAFREDVLQHTLEQVKAAKAKFKGTGYKLRDRLQWVICVANNYAQQHDIKVDWVWYYDLCGILEIDLEPAPRPLIFPKIQGSQYKHGSSKPAPIFSHDEQIRRWKKELEQRVDRAQFYGYCSPRDEKVIAKLRQQIEDGETEDPQNGKISPWQQMQRLLPLEARIDTWKEEVGKLEAMMNKLPEPDPYNLKGLLMRNIENAKDELKKAEELLERESSNEKQVVLHQDSPYSVA